MFGRWLDSPRELLLRRFDALFGGDEWRPLLDFVSPTFFDVVPLRALLSQGRELVANAADGAARRRLEDEVSAALAERGLAVRLVGTASGSPEPEVEPDPPALRGQRVLELYFAQLFGADAAFVDLRHGAFRDGPDAALWSPAGFHVRWDPDFLEAVRELYRGFYGGSEARFAGALERLGLGASRDLFERHFGDDPGAVTFDRGHFVETFHDVFVRCRDRGVRLHRNFLPLGVYLASLHEHLAALGGGPFDVRRAFERGAGDAR